MKIKLTKKRVELIAAVAVVLVIIVVWPKGKSAAVQNEQQVYTVQSSVITKTNLQEYLSMNGNVKADNSISVYPDIGGKLIEVPVTLGTYVKRGQVIAEVDPSTPGTVYAKSPVYAPIEGYVTSLPLTQGTTVSTSTAIAQLGNIKKLQIEAKVPERDIAVLKNGLTAEVSLEAYPGVTFPAHVFRVSPIVDETSRTKEIYLIFDTSDERINAGMYAKIKLNTVLHEGCITLPVNSFVTENGKQFVYAIKETDGKLTAVKKEVVIGVTVDGVSEIKSGVNNGEKIIISGMQVLKDGASVKDIGGGSK